MPDYPEDASTYMYASELACHNLYGNYSEVKDAIFAAFWALVRKMKCTLSTKKDQQYVCQFAHFSVNNLEILKIYKGTSKIKFAFLLSLTLLT